MSPRELSLEEARALVPFSVLLPTLLPEGARLSGCLLAPDDPPGWLGLTYVIDPGARNSLHIQQDPSVASGAQDLVAWEHAMVDDVELRIQERGGEGFPHPPRLIFSGPETRGENMKTTTMKTTTPMAAIAALVLASDALPAQADHGRRT